MKKYFLCSLLFVICSFVYGQTAVIKELTGSVELKISGAGDFVPASVGAQLAQNTIISTGFKSTAILQTGSALITVRPLTRLTLTEIQAMQDTETLNLNLQAGRVRVDVNPPAGTKASLEIASPASVASVRGTSFEFDTRNLRVNSGTVVFMGKWGYQVSVQEGHTSAVGVSGSTAVPQSARGYGSTATPTGGTGFTSNTGGGGGGGGSGGGGGGSGGGGGGDGGGDGGSTGTIGVGVGFPD
jgi:hypothetical protein